MKRRELLVGLGLSALAAPVLLSCGNPAGQAGEEAAAAPGAGDAAKAGEHEVDFLFVHSAMQTSLADGVLTLHGVGDSTIYFSDRPDRIAGQLTTEEFVANWSHGGAESFEADPPNAALSIMNGPMPQEIVVVLSAPRLEAGTLTYDVEVLEGNDSASGDASAVFIDVIGRPLTPLSVAGSRRRVRRRTRRRVG